MKTFSMTQLTAKSRVEHITEETAPDWLTSKNTIKGSTMDNRWFWNDHVLTLEVGQTVKTDFWEIERTA